MVEVIGSNFQLPVTVVYRPLKHKSWAQDIANVLTSQLILNIKLLNFTSVYWSYLRLDLTGYKLKMVKLLSVRENDFSVLPSDGALHVLKLTMSIQ